ncbi:peptide deformylase [Candidatus Gottesmanbacteria bacterium]|nr:peptide deformylase [Candidatus Gottesmanbacteria bacterium]
MKPIVLVPHPVLTTPATVVKTFDDKLLRLIKDMEETLLATVNPKGVGLAATQVGQSLRIFLTKPTAKAKIRTFINPEIINKSGALTQGVPERSNKMEGCLSIPNVWGNVHRSSTLTLRYQDETGAIHQEEFSGFLATIIQHETDHINGILFTQRVLEQKEKLFQVATDDDGEELLEEIKLT